MKQDLAERLGQPQWVVVKPRYIVQALPVMITTPARCVSCSVKVHAPKTGVTLNRCSLCGGVLETVPAV